RHQRRRCRRRWPRHRWCCPDSGPCPRRHLVRSASRQQTPEHISTAAAHPRFARGAAGAVLFLSHAPRAREVRPPPPPPLPALPLQSPPTLPRPPARPPCPSPRPVPL